jgi:predicted amidophosphoribosyltransferase
MKETIDEAMSYRLPLNVTEVFVLHNKYIYPVCPRCRTSFEREYQAYCDRCGQKLGWSEFKKAKLIFK